MKKFLILITTIIISISAEASDIVFVGSYVDSLYNRTNDVFLYYTGDKLDSLEVNTSNLRSKDSMITIRGESRISAFWAALVSTRERYIAIDKASSSPGFAQKYRLDASLSIKFEDEKDKTTFDKKIKWPEVHLSGSICDKQTDYEKTYFDIDVKPIPIHTHVINILGEKKRALRIITEAYGFYGDEFIAEITFCNIDQYDTFTKLVSIDNLRERIELKKQAINRAKETIKTDHE